MCFMCFYNEYRNRHKLNLIFFFVKKKIVLSLTKKNTFIVLSLSFILLMSVPSGILPTVALAPYVNTFSLFGNPSQGLQQFPQHLSNPPGQTVDWFFNVLTVLINLSTLLKTATTNVPTYVSYYTYATTTIDILKKIVSTVSSNYSNNERWSSPILPNKGYAANNTVNSGYNPLNVRSIRDSSGTTIDQIAGLLYYWLYFFNSEVSALNKTQQINHYTYEFLVNNVVTATDYSSTTLSQDVSFWINSATTTLATIINTNYSSFFGTPSSGSAWSIIQEIFTAVNVCPVDAVERIPLAYLLSPKPVTQGGSGADYTSVSKLATIVLLEVFAGTLYNNLSAITPALTKISSLYDPQTLTYVFDQAATSIQSAFTKISTYLENLNKAIVYNTVNTTLIVSPLSTDDFAFATTYTTKGSRTSSVDLNRIDGSLVPTLYHQQNYFIALQNLANYIITNDTTYSAVAPDPTYPSDFKTALVDIQTDSANVLGDFSTAISSFNSQLSIHYSRWSQNLTNI